ncbi:hypothetical protein M5J20_05340 [Corynebacterium sp. TA-R-1]|uniref:Secreted or membrane protein n=1 Tax=Corynebacterium stercoris TaxID=2943490 RepID=A0ABT1G0X0_9CORY|nr:hypothetical protein [Corynebacterium stercoris]MCP1387611.1 hypothetical protein [Corynebacterium stercoris]
MAYLLILLALIALAAGIWLWNADARERRAAVPAPREDLETSTVEPEPAPEAPAPVPPSEDETTPGIEPVLIDDSPEPVEDTVSLEVDTQGGEAVEPAQSGSTRWVPASTPAAAQEFDVADEAEYELDTPVPLEGEFELDTPEEPEPEPAEEPAHAEPAHAEPAPAPTPQAKPQPWQHRRSGLQLPGASRRERRSWAEANGFTFAKQDDFLTGEWQRGAASTGAPVRDIASGHVYGHDTHVMDLGDATVIAMATGEVSDMVVDMRRASYAAHFTAASSDDLVEVANEEGFTVYATEAGPAQRFIDIRVRTALNELPPAVLAAWFEGEWALAQLAGNGHSTPADWDATLAPLALLADAARTLPPRDPKPLDLDAITPEATAEVVPVERVEADVEKPKVQRPEEPLELPTRTTGAVRGPVELRAVGGDEVEAIADGTAPDATGDLTRARRAQTPPSIFQDATPEKERKR